MNSSQIDASLPEPEIGRGGGGVWSSLPREVRSWTTKSPPWSARCPRANVLHPFQLVKKIIKRCTPLKMAMLQSTCTYFRNLDIIDKIATRTLRAIPRAIHFNPDTTKHETRVALLQYILRQSAAAAQVW